MIQTHGVLLLTLLYLSERLLLAHQPSVSSYDNRNTVDQPGLMRRLSQPMYYEDTRLSVIQKNMFLVEPVQEQPDQDVYQIDLVIDEVRMLTDRCQRQMIVGIVNELLLKHAVKMNNYWFLLRFLPEIKEQRSKNDRILINTRCYRCERTLRYKLK